jgi:DNA repair protein RecN (Recombination protein N)
MLRELSIRNFAIIDDLRIGFSEGLTILSGETGAGKSIILNAVNLLLGSRASTDLIRAGENTAELEAYFDIDPRSRAAQAAAAHGYEACEGLLIRRLISRSDSNRVYVNGSLATLNVLSAVTESLASISGQHAHQGLLKEEEHLVILDQFGGLLSAREKVAECYRSIVPLIDELHRLTDMQRQQSQQIDLLKHQRDEIRLANPHPGEDAELEQERLRLKNAEFLYQTVFGGIEILYGESGSALERVAEVRKNLERAGQIDAQLQAETARLADISYQLEDLVVELRGYLKKANLDEHRLEEVEARLDVLNKLKRKYGGSLEAVLQTLHSIEQELTGIENIAERIGAAEETLGRLHTQLAAEARALSKRRQETAARLEQQVVRELTTLKMPGTRFQVALRSTPAGSRTSGYLTTDGMAIGDSGLDRAVFLIAPNVGEELKPLAGIASGGELSRVVLALKAILAETESLETIVFDEVDAGIGGGVAEVVGKKLHQLARHHQVICITHLPQIAKFADQHYGISKEVADGRTRTTLKSLETEDRCREIARMLGGEKITRTTLAHARELLEKKSQISSSK